jgi:LemA protein
LAAAFDRSMSTQQLWLVAGAALLMFWMLGAHNRLVALRNDIGAAWAQLDEPLQRRAATVVPLVAGVRGYLADEQGALDAVLAALAMVQMAAHALRPHPAHAPQAAALTSPEAALAAALARLLSLVEHRTDIAADATLVPHLAALRDAGQRLGFARQLFNDAVQRYNDAARQFPTRLLSSLFGFSAAGTL